MVDGHGCDGVWAGGGGGGGSEGGGKNGTISYHYAF